MEYPLDLCCLCVFKMVRTRLSGAGSCHLLSSKMVLWLEESLCLAPSVKTQREVVILDATEEEMVYVVKY